MSMKCVWGLNHKTSYCDSYSYTKEIHSQLSVSGVLRYCTNYK